MAAQDTICRLNELPESFLCSNIISRLSLVDAVRSSILCSNWRYLWTKIPHLSFSPEFYSHVFNKEAEDVIYVRETMEHILMQHDAPLESFGFHISRWSCNVPINVNVLEEIHIEQCIHHAAKKGVKKMLLKVDADFRDMKMDLPDTAFGCNALLYLELSRFVIPQIPKPTPSENFSFLKTCCLRNIENLSDKSLQGFLELCPVLQKLVILSCEELIDLKVQAANLNCFILLGCYYVESLIADCPQLCGVKIGSNSSLDKVLINSYNLVELKVWDCRILSKMQINSCVFLKEVGSLEALSIEELSNVGSLRKLSLTSCSSSRFHRFSCPNLVGMFSDLEELKVFPSMMGTSMVSREKNTSDFMFPNLKKASLFISSHQSKEDVAVLGFVLRNSPSLNTLIVNLLFCIEDFDDLEFKNQLLGLKRASEDVEIKVLNEDEDEDEEEYYEEPEDDEVEEEYYEETEDASPYGNQNDVQDYDWSGSEDGFWDRDDDYTSPRLLLHLMAHIEDDHDYEHYRGQRGLRDTWDF